MRYLGKFSRRTNEVSLIDLSKLPPEVQLQLQLQILGLFFVCILAIWVAVDAFERGWPKATAIFWGVGVLLVCIAFFPIYIFQRSRRAAPAARPAVLPVAPCRYCGKDLIGSPAFCPHCSAQLKSSEDIHRPSA